MLLVSDRGGALRIYEESGAGAARLLGNRGAGDRSTADSMPARLPDGRIVFVSDRDGNPEIYVAAADGEATRLNVDPWDRPAVDSGPAPLGIDRIVFARTEPGAPREPGVPPPGPPHDPRDLYTMRLDGSGRERLTHHPADDWAPSASGDGRSVVFVSDRTGSARIHLVPDVQAADAESATVCLSDFELPRSSPVPGGSASQDAAPAFLPDGSIVFSRGPEGGVPHLYVMGRSGARAGLRQITDSLTLRFGAAEPVVLDDRTILFVTGPIVDRNRRDVPVRFAVYRIALGGFNLTRVTRNPAPYADFTRHLAGR
jgi:Tol biopolymer transport system component